MSVGAVGVAVGEAAATNRGRQMDGSHLPERSKARSADMAYVPPPDTDLVFWLPSFIPCCASLSFLPFPSLPSLSPSFLVLIWFDWCRNVALLKVAAEEQWGIVLFHTHTHTKGM